jgi:serine kinase of HPr protein (carbohydrate metabolism regulator)
MLIHASAVAIQDQGVLIAGPSGAGKSSLVLRLIDEGAKLIADDQVVLESSNDDGLIASPLPQGAGLLEIRGIGIMRLPFIAKVPVRFYVELVTDPSSLERLPSSQTHSFLDCKLPA